MPTNYSIESGKLIIRDEPSGSLLWSGNFDGGLVYKILPLRAREGCLVLLDPGSSPKPTFENLLRVNASGEITWRASLPRSHDAFTDVLFAGTQIEAHTWNGIRVVVDVDTGQTREIGFSK